MGKTETVKSIRIIPRQEKGNPGLMRDYKVYIKEGEFKK
jgi:hypothetical protein